MDSLRTFITDRTADVLISGLIGRGFTHEQAQHFLPVVGSKVLFEFEVHGQVSDAQSMLANIDLSAIASVMGIDQKLLDDGIDYVVPNLISQLDGIDLDVTAKLKNHS